jgi:hypothetical protein
VKESFWKEHMMAVTNCSLCGGALVRGRAVVKRGYPFWLSRIPWIKIKLKFYPDDENMESQTVLWEDRRVISYQCSQCKALLLTQEKWSPTE